MLLYKTKNPNSESIYGKFSEYLLKGYIISKSML